MTHDIIIKNIQFFLVKKNSDFRLGREGFNHNSSSNYEDRVEALLGNVEKFFSGIPSIEKKISDRVRNYSHLNYLTYFDIHCISKVL